MKDIDYAAFYGVRPGEIDFSGAIKRSLKTGIKHLLYYLVVKELKDCSHFNNVNVISTIDVIWYNITFKICWKRF